MSAGNIDEELVGRARAAGEVIAPLAATIERSRRLPPEAVAALASAGVFKLLVPRAYGGSQASVATTAAVIEEVARADGSAGWCAMISATSGLMCLYLDDATAREVYGPADAATCGVFAPMGRAVREDGGFRVSGRWPFASGCEYSGWRMGGTIVAGDPMLPGGAPDVRSMLFRADETTILDTWDVVGMRGSGSHDIEAREVFVPAARSFSLLTDRPKQGAFAMPFFGTLATGVAAVGLGVARAAIDGFVALAAKKQPPGSKRTIAHRELVQVAVAQAEAKVGAARAFLHEALAAAEREVAAHGEASLRARARLRLAASHAASESAAAVDLMYAQAGATAIYARSPLQRQLRDAHVVTQHVMVAPTAAQLAGRVLLGLESDATML